MARVLAFGWALFLAGIALAQVDMDTPWQGSPWARVPGDGIVWGDMIDTATAVAGTPPTISITTPSASPEAASGRLELVSGTHTGVPASVTWSTSCVPGPTACTVSSGPPTFECVVTQTQDCAVSQTVTVTASNGAGSNTDTTDLVFPTFDLQPGSTGPNDLPDTLVVNSVSMDLVLACDAEDADVTAGTWVCRTNGGTETLTEVGTQAAPGTATPSHVFDSTERLFQCGSRSWESTSTTLGNVGTDDMVFEYFGRTSTANADSTVSTANDNTTAAGWKLYMTTAGMRTYVGDGVAGTASNAGLARASAFGHQMGFVDRSENSTNGHIVYANGVAATGVNPSAVTGNASSSNKITFCADPDNGDTDNNSALQSIRIFRCAGCMAGGASNPTQWAPIARERAGVAHGVDPLLAVGTDGLTTLSRTTANFVDVVDSGARQLYVQHANSPRLAMRSAAGTPVQGWLFEPTTTNLALQSQTLGTTWVAITAGDNVHADTWTPPFVASGATGDEVDGNNSDAEHGLRQSISLTAATHTLSAWARQGSQSVVALRDNTVANAIAYFDLNACAGCTIGEDNCTGVAGTVGAGVSNATAALWPIDTNFDGSADDEACRVSITFTGTAAAHDIDLLCAQADNDATYLDADALADCGWWGVQLEAISLPTSYSPTTTAGVIRSRDDFRYDGVSHYTGSPSTMDAAVLCPDHDLEFGTTIISAGTTTLIYSRLGGALLSDRINAEGLDTATQWNILGTAEDIGDGAEHTMRVTMQTNQVEAFADGVSIGTDTTATIPTAVGSSLFFGSKGGTQAQGSCLLTRARLWNRLVTPTEAP